MITITLDLREDDYEAIRALLAEHGYTIDPIEVATEAPQHVPSGGRSFTELLDAKLSPRAGGPDAE